MATVINWSKWLCFRTFLKRLVAAVLVLKNSIFRSQEEGHHRHLFCRCQLAYSQWAWARFQCFHLVAYRDSPRWLVLCMEDLTLSESIPNQDSTDSIQWLLKVILATNICYKWSYHCAYCLNYLYQSGGIYTMEFLARCQKFQKWAMSHRGWDNQVVYISITIWFHLDYFECYVFVGYIQLYACNVMRLQDRPTQKLHVLYHILQDHVVRYWASYKRLEMHNPIDTYMSGPDTRVECVILLVSRKSY